MKKHILLLFLVGFTVQQLGAVKTTFVNQSKDIVEVQGYGIGCAGVVLGSALMCGIRAERVGPGQSRKITYKTKQFGTRGGIRVKSVSSGAMYDVKSPNKTFKKMSNPVYFPRQFGIIKQPMPLVINNSKEEITVLGKGVGCIKVKKGITLVCDEYKIKPGGRAYINEKGTIYAYDKADNRFEVKGKLDGKTFYYPKNFRPGGVAVKNNKADKTITVVAKRVGCLGTSEGEITTCRTKKIQPGKTSILDIKYPYSSGFELIAFYDGKRYKTPKKFANGQTAKFPDNFRPAIKGAYATVEIRNSSKASVTFVSRRLGCMGTSKGMLTTCKTETIKPGTSSLMGIKYPYSSGYELVAFAGKNKYMCDRKVKNDDSVNFPGDFTLVSRLDKIDGRLRYDQGSILGSHNAYSSTAYGYAYAQQFLNITQQLNVGARSLELDVHLNKNCQIMLCHGTCGLTKLLKAGSKPQSLKNSLIEIKNWLNKNKTEVVNIAFEDKIYRYQQVAEAPAKKKKPSIDLDLNKCKKKVANPADYMDLENQVIESVFGKPGPKNIILTKKDWDPAQHNGEWPTYDWMRKNNKRLILFNYDGSPKARTYSFHTSEYLSRSKYGTMDAKKICAPDAGYSKINRLYSIPYFPTISMGIKRTFDLNYNSYYRIWKVIDTCQKHGDKKNILPHKIEVDFVDKNSEGLRHVINRLNKIKTQKFLPTKQPKKPIIKAGTKTKIPKIKPRIKAPKIKTGTKIKAAA